MKIKPITPLSSADYCSPYDLLKKECSRLKDALHASQNGARTLDIMLLNRALLKFVKDAELWEEFKRLNPGIVG